MRQQTAFSMRHRAQLPKPQNLRPHQIAIKTTLRLQTTVQIYRRPLILTRITRSQYQRKLKRNLHRFYTEITIESLSSLGVK